MFVLKWNVAIQGELKSENNISGTTVLFRVNVSITRANELIQLMVKFTPHDTVGNVCAVTPNLRITSTGNA